MQSRSQKVLSLDTARTKTKAHTTRQLLRSFYTGALIRQDQLLMPDPKLKKNTEGASIPISCREVRRVDISRGRSVNSSASTPNGTNLDKSSSFQLGKLSTAYFMIFSGNPSLSLELSGVTLGEDAQPGSKLNKVAPLYETKVMTDTEDRYRSTIRVPVFLGKKGNLAILLVLKKGCGPKHSLPYKI
ncbi:hypothetical protein M9H77_13187 [Catharanthus roseus]|uniref:Uncharacterized protein n=1 Tax=Catharanthus roseus TaxID=4058 RepID=A0ACC0BJN3_CATRO|nr:hypothetical protein M9H77_13187 [Catharanthus roseus]